MAPGKADPGAFGFLAPDECHCQLASRSPAGRPRGCPVLSPAGEYCPHFPNASEPGILVAVTAVAGPARDHRTTTA